MQNNPWLGLLSYEDPQKTNTQFAFCGRDAAISSLFAMVDNNLLVTIYGKTGIGKTSVLNAGIFPILRNRNYLPVSIRLGKYDSTKETPFAKRIISYIEEEIRTLGGRIDTNYPDYASTNTSAVDALWRYFGTSIFRDKNGNEVYPVIALDQLEEIFIKQPEEAGNLLMQIHALMDDNREIPDLEGYNDTTNFRFIFSIREDDLFYLEDSIDMNHLAEMKQNRYRLAPLSEQEAKEVVMLGKEYLEEGFEEEITARIIELAKDSGGLISTNILSLVCCQLFNQQHGHITIDAMTDSSKNPLDSFYINCVAKIAESSRKYIEETLVDADRRKFVNKEDFISHVKEDAETLMDGQYKIIQDVKAGNRKCVELIHDSLARTIYHLKAEAEEREKNEKLRKHNMVIKFLGIVLLCALATALGVVYLLMTANKKYRDEKGRGITQKIAITFQEDSLIIAERDYWRGKLLVIGENDHSEDTLLAAIVNDEYHDSTLYVTLDSAKNVKILLKFSKKDYQTVDTSFTVGQLTDSPKVTIPIGKIQANYISYSSQVITELSNGRGKEKVNIQEAIVIIRDKVQKTDSKGNFTFKFKEEDSLTVNDVIYIVKKGFALLECSNIVDDSGTLPPQFCITTADSLATFKSECEQMNSDSIVWHYSTTNDKNTRGEEVEYKNNNTHDRLVLKATIVPGQTTAEGNYIIKGYYYLESEYKNRGYLAYNIFTGWMDKKKLSEDKKNSKPFEVESYNFANNKQKIIGRLWYSGRFTGEIKDIGGLIATFGPQGKE